ncbi:sigma-54 interaction domain-containing protein [Burkholderia seminalis]|uniref:sigma-54 interaction domain-containing protein n=1 Tax=Burkholderia seminalis TaxID=488731 RepID=UPI000F596EAD|nr:sigma 54-interacting transcriptional regulator [Burkholderia seminalis]MBJ9595441.1 sigma 54-interacting transcriptional regulator [Burkholderia seminalis]MCA8430136.1 sigma 54-interacting transcriptional regulator [Burkholderia seminalis]RQS85348.1 sigma-54-dependent Fis family transcriptional regulator [Burkholderia seminalis]VWB13357.1 Fis family transcriptional regulator [Burkholderia seminalis]
MTSISASSRPLNLRVVVPSRDASDTRDPAGLPAAARTASVLTLPGRPAQVRARTQVFADPRSLALLEEVHRVAPSDANVLIVGETGTGKELIARHVHDLGNRRDGPFVAVNCGAFSETLVDSELFGHEKGAFTGAVGAKPGWFEAAHGGTLFLDEIGDLPLSMQVKLLRVLQEREVVRLGSRTGIPVDVRVVAATNVDLQQAVAAGHFRGDLYYRLNVVQLAVPPLRERPGDILPLARHFFDDYRARLGAGPRGFDPRAERRLVSHHWPGNIRELENAIHHALLVCRHDVLHDTDLHLASPCVPPAAVPAPEPSTHAQAAFEHALRDLLDDGHGNLFEHIEDTVMRVAFDFSHRNQIRAAQLLGISRNVLRARLIRAKEIAALK